MMVVSMAIPAQAVNLKYALITPAWNEEKHLEELIRSVSDQTVLPVRWVVVSDGSTDRTDEIVRSAASRFPWIILLRLERDPERHFAGKAHAVNAGYASLKGVVFDLVGNLDADMTLPPDFYEFLISRFKAIPNLGVAGAPFVEDTGNPGSHSHAFSNLDHVSGACQLFRRRCFEHIGGYRPIKGGGIDWVAVTTARMLGWTTRTFVERTCVHHRTMGTADRSPVKARFRHGQEDYYVGNHPLWEVARSFFQMKNQPFIVGGLSLLSGYVFAWVSGKLNPIPSELRVFHRREQMKRLYKAFQFMKRPQA
ncbi:MAG: glycosyltransferase family 2 protein [Nitrospira sp.]|nr:glycosyltransferase family 2 protein [Nitrospira sp.]